VSERERRDVTRMAVLLGGLPFATLVERT